MNFNYLKAILRGLAILALIATSSAVASALSEQGLASFTHMDLVANIETIGVTVSGSGLPKTAELSV